MNAAELSQKLGLARELAVENEKVFWLEPIFRLLSLKFSEGVDTALVTRQGVVEFNPAWCASLTVAEATAVLTHEALHLYRLHCERYAFLRKKLGGEIAAAWRYAADAEVNDDLSDLGFHLPAGSVLPQVMSLPPHRLAEEYTLSLLKTQTSQLPNLKPCQGSGVGPRSPLEDNRLRGSSDSSDGDARPHQDAPPNPDLPPQESGASGSEDGAPRQGPPTDAPREGEVPPRSHPQGTSSEESEETEEGLPADIAAAVREAARTLLRDDRPSILRPPRRLFEHAVTLLSQSSVDWLSLLRGYVFAACDRGRGFTTYMHPPRRPILGSGAHDLILPGQRAGLVRFGLLLDVSDSMEKPLKFALDQVFRLLQQTRRPLDVYLGTNRLVATISAATDFVSIRLQVEKVRGGFTNLGRCLSQIAETGRPYDLVLVLTDAETSWDPWLSRPAPWAVVPVVFDSCWNRYSYDREVMSKKLSGYKMPYAWWTRAVWVHLPEE